MESGQFNTDVEVIMGSNSDEGILSVMDVLRTGQWDEFRNNFDVFGPRNLFNIANDSEITNDVIETTNKLIEYYVGSKENIDENHQQGLFDMFTDSVFVYGTYKTINYMVQRGMLVYQYIFTYQVMSNCTFRILIKFTFYLR